MRNVNTRYSGLKGRLLGSAAGSGVLSYISKSTATATIGPYTQPVTVQLMQWGAGGGANSNGPGGGGAAATLSTFLLLVGESVVVTVGQGGSNADGGDSHFVHPRSGLTVTAGGGKKAATGTGGTPTNGDLNRAGGAGGTASLDGAAGANGGAGGVGSHTGGSGGSGGGGAGGFSDKGDYPLGNGNGYVQSNASGPGGGAGGGLTFGGNNGQVLAIVTQGG